MVDEGYTSGQPITALQAAWNVTNAIQGMFIVGLPIAVKVSFEYSNIKKKKCNTKLLLSIFNY